MNKDEMYTSISQLLTIEKDYLVDSILNIHTSTANDSYSCGRIWLYYCKKENQKDMLGGIFFFFNMETLLHQSIFIFHMPLMEKKKSTHTFGIRILT